MSNSDCSKTFLLTGNVKVYTMTCAEIPLDITVVDNPNHSIEDSVTMESLKLLKEMYPVSSLVDEFSWYSGDRLISAEIGRHMFRSSFKLGSSK